MDTKKLAHASATTSELLAVNFGMPSPRRLDICRFDGDGDGFHQWTITGIYADAPWMRRLVFHIAQQSGRSSTARGRAQGLQERQNTTGHGRGAQKHTQTLNRRHTQEIENNLCPTLSCDQIEKTNFQSRPASCPRPSSATRRCK